MARKLCANTQSLRFVVSAEKSRRSKLRRASPKADRNDVMKKRAKRWASALLFATGAVSTTLLLKRRKAMDGKRASRDDRDRSADKWARPGMRVTFRAELMPGRSRSERTFKIVKVLPSNRVTLEGFAGEHTETEFETAR